MTQQLSLEPPVYNLGHLNFSPTSGVVETPGGKTLLRAREANLLTALIDSFPDVLSRTEIEAKLWKDSYATNATINQTVKALRFSLQDENRSVIRTIPKQGYVLSVAPKIQEEVKDTYNIEPAEAVLPEAPPSPKNQTLIAVSLVVVALSFIAFIAGYSITRSKPLDRVSHMYKNDWYLSSEIPMEFKEAFSSGEHETRYIMKTNDGYRICVNEDKELTCSLKN
ncbi:winged helix-turn-helix domain-containing protein [Vibrio chagasii]|uniref:winged helix-turn-helix domain-containing protein n=1 Tax=Vibrio chagasii TaxID=170679 RepID=UPI0022837345|nr:winged helix-turn-helix domain-containing protein [Vibrio chagasii]MCY9824552.1 winged helix-turn-helix domain-containing protein [Vibrio chagasii]